MIDQIDAADDAANSDSMHELGTMDCHAFPDKFPHYFAKHLPLRISVAFTLTEWTCVYRSLYEEFAVDSLEDVLTSLLRNHQVFLIYRFYSETVTPAWKHAVDWPLRRRGKLDRSVTDWTPYGVDIEESNMLFELRNRPLGPYKSRLMLKTGGRTLPDACDRWGLLANAIRQQVRILQPYVLSQP